MKLKELKARIGEGNFPWAAFKADDCQGVALGDGNGDTLFDVALIPIEDGDLEPGDIKFDDFNADCIAYLVHCVNNFALVTDALREALTQLDYENGETRETSRWPEWYAALAEAQTAKEGK